jgi:hypothetical protein
MAKSETMSQPRRDSLEESANTKRHVAEVFTASGLAAGAVAVWLYVRDPSHERVATASLGIHVVPMAGGLALLGRF